MHRLLALVLASVAVAGAPADANRLKPDHAPTPFSAEQIRQGCLDGRTSTFLVEAMGKDARRQTFRFQGCDEKGCEIEVAQATKDGKALGKPAKQRTTWKQLQSHASFPERSTKITEASVETPAGTFDCWLYVVTIRAVKDTTVHRFHFAKKLPGPPVKMTTKFNDQVTRTMTLVAHKNGQAPPPKK